ncbi:PLP-dependent aminotransferase family protein [Desulforamulus aeronauticus]|uniref:DNA-binding transcriptional regulator, MocR family, contains an aminotransferase domain n=1 Tax=Desulforamulus aeronauticus DSM 10349 TaxID=1121421 RepID=A0A1M6VR01_9FIRM|nr:PLP-dependent aminotransferase family protein [Desulforamulus aeronauticus]SHK83920.1 DNA-binding transcriptional regulator, MocR family, contains an aminotransferase domain [Desulforamulus aeronauticus DSM 10349]
MINEWCPTIKTGDKPLYIALANALESDINSGILKPGDKLPPQRELADQIGVNLSTVTRAFRVCELKGLISGVVGRGTFVASDVKIPLSLISQNKSPDIIQMGQVLPLYSIDKDTARIAKTSLQDMDMERLIKYSEPAGYVKHRVIGAEWLKRFNISASADEILITPGSQNAIAICMLTLFEHGDRIAVDALTYPGIKALAAMYGIRLIPIEMTDEGMNPEVLVSICKNEGIKGIYLMPEVQNPTTCSMTQSGREQVADIIRKHDLVLIEDDAYSYTGSLDSIPISALAPEQGIYIGGTSKLLGPGFRISFVRVPNTYIERMKKGLLNTSWMASPITAEMVTKLIETGKSEAVLKDKRAEAHKRNELARKKLSQYTVLSRPYGFFQWLILPDGWQGRDFEICAREAGVQVFCAEKFAVGSCRFPPAIRISLSGPDTIEELEKGLDILKGLLLKGHEHQTIII